MQEIANRAHGDAAAQFAEEKRTFLDAGGGTIVLDGAQGRGPDRTKPVLAALAGDAEGFPEDIDIADIELHEFVEPQPGAVKKLQNSGIPLGGPTGGALRAIRF